MRQASMASSCSFLRPFNAFADRYRIRVSLHVAQKDQAQYAQHSLFVTLSLSMYLYLSSLFYPWKSREGEAEVGFGGD